MIPGIVAGRAVKGGVDPLWADVELLLPFNGSNGSTSFPDVSSRSRPTAGGGGATQITTSRSKWGGSSLDMAGHSTQSRIGISSPAADWKFLHTDDTPFTIEGWFLWDSLSTTPGIVTNATSTAHVGFGAWVSSAGALSIQIFRGSTGTYTYTATSSTGVITTGGAWKFVQIILDPSLPSNQLEAYVDGTRVIQVSRTGSSASSADPTYGLAIGAHQPSGGGLDGGINDLRITKALRTPGAVPSAAFPTS